MNYAFPEHLFPPDAQYRAEYEQRVGRGRERMRQTRVVIAGLARNIAPVLAHTAAGMEALGALFADYKIVIYENDSADRTPSLLAAWAARNPRVVVNSQRLGDPVNPTARCLARATRMARYRNACLEIVQNRFADHEYLILVDTDLRIGWSLDGVANTFGQDDWDFVGSNGIIYRRTGRNLNKALQYDAWAFRQDHAFTPLGTREVNQMQWHRGQPLVPVTCSFGGLGVYRMAAYLAGRYSGDDVDHVTHQQAARAAGFDRVYLNPSQITVYGRHRRKADWYAVPLMAWLTGQPVRGRR